jgi:membrane associated rhomboid family serine protease
MPPVTRTLIIANVVVYLVQMAMPTLVVPFALWPLGAARATGGQVSFEAWQLVPYAFLHGGLAHIAFNMFALYMFGSPFEQVVGQRRYTIYYFVCVVTAAIAQLSVMQLSGAIYPSIGASGGVFGLLLAYAAYFPRNKVFLIFFPVPLPSRVFVFIYAAIELFFGVTGTQEGVAHFAHLGGLVGGIAMIAYWRNFGRVR